MKNIFYLAFLLLFSSITVFAQSGEVVDVETFKTLTVKGGFNIVFSTGKPQLNFQTGNTNDVKIENKNGILSIIDIREDKSNLYDIVISSPELINLNLEIDGDFEVNRSAIFFSTLNFNGSIKGETKLNLNGEIFAGNFNSCGKITVEGTVDKLYLNLSNSKDLITHNLTAQARFINQND